MDDDILMPQLVWINGSCYRKNAIRSKPQKYTGGDTMDDYQEDDLNNHYKDQEYTHDENAEARYNYVIEKTNSQYQAKLQIASAFFPMVIGKGGSTKTRIEKETNARITIPKKGIENEDILISGESKTSVGNACSRILLIVESSRSKMEHTHFISIPFNSKEMQNALLEFKHDVLKKHAENTNEGNFSNLNATNRTIHESLFQTPSLLHLTIGALSLMDSRERQEACELLQECHESIILPLLGPSPLKIDVSGLEIMNDDPAEVDVIYAKVQPANQSENILQRISDLIVDKFVNSGLMRRQYDRVKLHVTVMNSLFRKNDPAEDCDNMNFRNPVMDNEQSYKGKKIRETIDARDILNEFGSRHFCNIEFKEIHLSQLKAGRRTEENYYWPSAVVNISSCG